MPNESTINDCIDHGKKRPMNESGKATVFSGFDKRITIPKGVKRILEGSLYGLDFVTDIVLPSSLEYFTPLAIFDLSREFIGYSRTSINLHIENSDRFVTVNGSLYTKDMKKLIYTPPKLSDDTLEIPEGVEELCEASCAFVKPRKWRLTVKLPSTLKRISKNAFSGVTISTLDVSPSVELARGAFANCQISDLTLHREVIPTDCFADCESFYHGWICNTVKRIEKHAFKLGKVTNIYISPETEVDSEFIDLSGTDADKNKLTIGGEIGSSAHKYAEANGIRFIEVSSNGEEIEKFLEGNHNISSSNWAFDEDSPF